MPFVAIDDSIAFAIDAPIKSSDIRQVDQNVDYLKALFDITFGHDHGGGADSGKPVVLADNSVTTAKIAAGAVTGAKISKAFTWNNLNITNGATWTPAAGVYLMVESVTPACKFQIWDGGSITEGSHIGLSGVYICNGTNMKVFNAGGTSVPVYYLTF